MAAAKSNQKMSPMIKWTVVGAVVVVGYTFLSGGDSAAPPAEAKKTKKSAKDLGIYTEEDSTAKFAMVSAIPRDVFNPLVKKTPAAAMIKPGAQTGLDAKLTGGEGGWFYTGMVELDGKREALLENNVSGESVYVSAGETWKAARIASVDISTVVMVAPDGSEIKVPITEYGATPGAVASNAAPAGNQPLAPIRGQIGAGGPANIGVRPVAGMATMTMPDGSTMQVPFDQNALSNGQGNGGRRRGGGGRRNRNNNNAPQGDY